MIREANHQRIAVAAPVLACRLDQHLPDAAKGAAGSSALVWCHTPALCHRPRRLRSVRLAQEAQARASLLGRPNHQLDGRRCRQLSSSVARSCGDESPDRGMMGSLRPSSIGSPQWELTSPSLSSGCWATGGPRLGPGSHRENRPQICMAFCQNCAVTITNPHISFDQSRRARGTV
jgi:hypothetical protein